MPIPVYDRKTPHAAMRCVGLDGSFDPLIIKRLFQNDDCNVLNKKTSAETVSRQEQCIVFPHLADATPDTRWHMN
ncbi:hypothetical protein [Dyella tabacisoli]|uniref:hypothetical protein n=1 Tax=Dyella tabacisoli TaxID=2282381 RepID=UPI0013B3A885|nr:hypothetical protein [Dyella tabacisoli]